MKMLARAAVALPALLVCAPAIAQHATTSYAPGGPAPEQACVTWTGATIGSGTLVPCPAVAGGGGGGGSNAAASATGSAVPSYADYAGYIGLDGKLHGWAGDNAGHPYVTIFGITSVAQPDVYGSGTIAAATANASYAIAPSNGEATGTVVVSGLSGSGAALTPEGSYDGTTWSAVPVVAAGGKTGTTTVSTDGQYRFNVSGRRGFRFRVSTIGTGTITAASTLSNAPYDPPAVALDSNGNATVYTSGLRYQLLGTYGGAGQTSGATGTAVGPVIPGSYIFSCMGTFGGGTVTLQVLGADGATFQTVSGISLTAPGNVGVVMPNIVGASGSGSVTAPNARAVLTGATSPSVFCSLS